MLVLLGMFAAVQFSPSPNRPPGVADPPAFASAGSTLELGSGLMRAAPAAAIAPLSDEMRKLDRDLSDAEQFLMAALP